MIATAGREDVVYGPPGLGKTFLAQMILLSALREDWEIVHVSGEIKEAWDALKPGTTKQLFYFNDFLGETRLEVSENEPTNLLKFIDRIRRLRRDKRFIMTTRGQILKEGARAYDSLRPLEDGAERLGVRVDGYRPAAGTIPKRSGPAR